VIVTDHRRKQAPADPGAVIRGQHVENAKLRWPVSIRVFCRPRHRDPNQLATSLRKMPTLSA
jgi:hypothetical protein